MPVLAVIIAEFVAKIERFAKSNPACTSALTDLLLLLYIKPLALIVPVKAVVPAKILFDKVCTEVVLTCSNPPTTLPSCKNNKFLSVSTISSASAPTNVEVLAVLPLRNRNSVDMLIFILGHGTKIY